MGIAMSFDDVAARMKQRHSDGIYTPDPIMVSSTAVDRRAAASRDILLGIVFMAVGIVVTAVTYDSANRSGGGTYVVAYGPIVVGFIKLIRGLARRAG